MEILLDWKIMTVYYDGLVYFTKGAAQYCGLEIELKISLEPNQAKDIIDGIVAYCKINQCELDEFIKIKLYNRDIFFKKMKSLSEKGKDAWRIVLPDNYGNLPDDLMCNPDFKKQIDS